MNEYKIAVVGCGGRSSAHIEAYQHIAGAKVVACSVPSSNRRDALAVRYGLRAYADTAEMIRKEKPDLVHLVTRPNTRVQLMTLVSELGVPACTVEKPIAVGVCALWINGPTAMRCGDPKTEWQHVRVAAYAGSGRVDYEEFGVWEIVSPDGVEKGDFGGMAMWWSNNLKAQAAFHQAMFDWIEDDSKMPGTNLKQSLHEWHVVLALYASALDRRPIEMADFNPPEGLFDRLGHALKETT